MVENMDSTRDVWAMQLDTIRNRIIRVELLVAVASFSLMVSTVPASFFGMNLTSGLEVHGPRDLPCMPLLCPALRAPAVPCPACPCCALPCMPLLCPALPGPDCLPILSSYKGLRVTLSLQCWICL